MGGPSHARTSRPAPPAVGPGYNLVDPPPLPPPPSSPPGAHLSKCAGGGPEGRAGCKPPWRRPGLMSCAGWSDWQNHARQRRAGRVFCGPRPRRLVGSLVAWATHMPVRAAPDTGCLGGPRGLCSVPPRHPHAGVETRGRERTPLLPGPPQWQRGAAGKPRAQNSRGDRGGGGPPGTVRLPQECPAGAGPIVEISRQPQIRCPTGVKW